MKIWKPFFCIALLNLFLIGCKNKSDQSIEVYKSLNNTLVNATRDTRKQVDIQLAKIQAEIDDSLSHNQMILRKKEIDVIDSLSKKMTAYIRDVKGELLKKAFMQDGNVSNGDSTYRLDNTSAVEEVFQKAHIDDELYENLTNYKNYMFGLDEEIRPMFTSGISNWIDTSGAEKDLRKKFENLFDKASVISVLALLNKYEYEIMHLEHELLQYFIDQVSVDAIIWDVYRPIFSQSADYARPGQDMELSASLGAINSKSNPVFSFNGKYVPMEDFTATYNFKASKKPGMHLNHLDIIFKDQFGKKQVMVVDIPYTVIKDSCSTN